MPPYALSGGGGGVDTMLHPNNMLSSVGTPGKGCQANSSSII